MSNAPARRLVTSAFVAFAAFGGFWGVWGASVPRVQEQAGVSDGELGFALLFVGAGALPSMLSMGRALDRWGLKVAALAIGTLGVIGAVLALTSVNLVALCVGLALIGASSGATDVSVNTVAGRAERVAGRPVITRAHGVFSSLVVLSSLATGLSSGASLPLAVPFVAVAALALLAGAAMLRALPPRESPEPAETQAEAAPARTQIVPLILIGVLGALAFASENAHQSWSGIFAHDELHSGTGLAAVAPAVFAGTVALTRFVAGGLKAVHAQVVLLVGALTAMAGTAVIAAAHSLPVAALGLAMAGAGTSVLFPTLIGIVSRSVEESRRGRATSIVTSVSYLGFLLGPVYVGLWADAEGLRGAMVAVAALAAALLVLAPVLLRHPRIRTGPPRPIPEKTIQPIG